MYRVRDVTTRTSSFRMRGGETGFRVTLHTVHLAARVLDNAAFQVASAARLNRLTHNIGRFEFAVRIVVQQLDRLRGNIRGQPGTAFRPFRRF